MTMTGRARKPNQSPGKLMNHKSRNTNWSISTGVASYIKLFYYILEFIVEWLIEGTQNRKLKEKMIIEEKDNRNSE